MLLENINPEYERMRLYVSRFFPELSKFQVAFLCNLIGNKLRSSKTDIYDVQLSLEPFCYGRGYFHHFEVEAELRDPDWYPEWFARLLGCVRKYRIYVRVTID